MTVPVNCPMLVTVMVLVALPPIELVNAEGLAATEKSPTFRVSVTV